MDSKSEEDQSLVDHTGHKAINDEEDESDYEPRVLGGKCGSISFFQIRLNKGVTPINIIFYWIAVIATIGGFVFINAVSGYVLTNFLNIPQDNQGTYAGDLAFYNELAIIPTVSFWGWVSDKTGRMPVYVIALLFMAIGIFLHAFARTWTVLVIYRLVFALGAAGAASMITALLGDYPRNGARQRSMYNSASIFFFLPRADVRESRGRAGGVMGLASGVGALLGVFVYLHIPDWFHSFDVIAAGQCMFYIVSGITVFGAILLVFGLQRGKPAVSQHMSWVHVIKDGFKAGKKLEVIVAYVSSFAARGDSFVAATFLTLWIHKYYIDHQMDPKEAIARAGMVSGIAQTCALVFAPFVGALADKLTRLMTVFLSAVIALVGYYMMFFINEPIGPEIIIAAILIGCGEVGMIVSSQILVAVEAPAASRGAVSGFYGLCASLGILTATKLGGFLFDTWTEGAPFLIFAIANTIVAILSITVYLIRRRQASSAYSYA